MAEQKTEPVPPSQTNPPEAPPEKVDPAEYVKGGKGRKDDVRGSRIFPASSPDAPAGAEIRGQEEFVHHSKPRRKPGDEPGLDEEPPSSDR